MEESTLVLLPLCHLGMPYCLEFDLTEEPQRMQRYKSTIFRQSLVGKLNYVGVFASQEEWNNAVLPNSDLATGTYVFGSVTDCL